MKKLGLITLITTLSLSLVACMSNDQIERISVKPFGTLNDGRDVQVYTLRNNIGTSIDILDLGGMIISINTTDREGNFADITLGFDNPEQYLTDSPYMGAIIGRYGNRIANGKFSLDGQDYTLAINNDVNALHGGIIGFDKQIWKAVPSSSDTSSSLSLTLISKDGDEGYPGTLTTNVTYTFDDENRLTLDYTATTDQATVLNLTQHAYFNLNGHNAGSILDHEMMLNADHYTPINVALIPTGEIAPVSGTPMDFTSPKAIGRDIAMDHQQLEFGLGYDHNWVLNKSAEGEMTLAASVYSVQTGRTLKAYTTEPGVQFYTGNFLDGSFTGKDNTTYPQRSGFCLETQHFPDSPNQPNFPSTILRPGEQYKTQTIFEFGIK
ncbi:MAG: galactose mutarotase [Kordiimonadaceae bacterium]|jgi:aldose 1-epimerase|nr:galactose mutarotase [Kordiimonadaceae bacterium]MBT6032425.1 galactose mutarotase [Kordiimonadaceae bacterium]